MKIFHNIFTAHNAGYQSGLQGFPGDESPYHQLSVAGILWWNGWHKGITHRLKKS